MTARKSWRYIQQADFRSKSPLDPQLHLISNGFCFDLLQSRLRARFLL